MKASPGFTLIELIAVMVIIGIVALVAAPRFFQQSTFDARRFHDAAISAIRYGQKTAIAQHRNVFVVATANSVALCFDSGCAATVPSPADGSAFMVQAPPDIALTPAAFSFNALGQPNPNAQATLNITGDPTPRQIVVERETGYVHP